MDGEPVGENRDCGDPEGIADPQPDDLDRGRLVEIGCDEVSRYVRQHDEQAVGEKRASNVVTIASAMSSAHDGHHSSPLNWG